MRSTQLENPESVQNLERWLGFAKAAVNPIVTWGSKSGARRLLFWTVSLFAYAMIFFAAQYVMFSRSNDELKRYGQEIQARGDLVKLHGTRDLLELCIEHVDPLAWSSEETCTVAKESFANASPTITTLRQDVASSGNPLRMLAEIRHEIRTHRGILDAPKLPRLSLLQSIQDHWLLLLASIALTSVIIGLWIAMTRRSERGIAELRSFAGAAPNLENPRH